MPHLKLARSLRPRRTGEDELEEPGGRR
jgi:hypothetical protein